MSGCSGAYTLGYSPCPNDTFIFHALAVEALDPECHLFSDISLADVETLNRWALKGLLDVTKLSFHALAHVGDRYSLLSAGAALGRGCGPLLVAGPSVTINDIASARIAIPGRYTTAAFLLRLFRPSLSGFVEMPFDRIMPAVAAGEVDAGVIIHESRFTYPSFGLTCLQDLGAWWEELTGLPIPLGGIAARRQLGDEAIFLIERCIRASVRHAFADPLSSRSYVKHYAQELDDNVIAEHIKLYVNPFSEDLGDEGRAAVREFFRMGIKAGIVPENTVLRAIP